MSSRPLWRGVGWAAVGVLAATFALSSAAQAAAGTGTIAGVITDNGAPVSGATISVSTDDGTFWANGSTDESGHYSVADVPEASAAYIVAISPLDHPTQYAFGKSDYSAADRISVTAGQTTTVDDSLLPTGTISGRFTDQAGNGLAGAWVDAFGDGVPNSDTQTGVDGSYRLAALPGIYQIGFYYNGLTQYAHGARSPSDADEFTVVAGQTTTVDEIRIATGSIAGHLTYADGTPAADVSVLARPEGASSLWATTDANGYYQMEGPVDTYRVSFQLPSGATQWAHQKRSDSAADPISITADTQTTVDEQLLPTGRLEGRFTAADGSPLSGVYVSVTADGPSTGEYIQATTDENGHYQVDRLFTGAYRVGFEDYQTNLRQWAYGKVTAETADVVTVSADQTTTVDDQRLPTGSVRVTATDSVTGAAISNFWVELNGNYGGASGGVAVVGNVPVGTYTLSAGGEGYADAHQLAQVTVVAGQQTEVAIKLRPVGKITTRVIDRETGEPVAGICVLAAQPTRFSFPDGCGAESDAEGDVTVTVQDPGAYNLFVLPKLGSKYGAQWLGKAGGTGVQTEAKTLTVAAGQTVAAPMIKLDRAGIITGRATSATGQPLESGAVGIVQPDLGAGSDTRYTPIAADGTYRVDFLGPYAWPLMFVAKDHAYQWSGGTGNRQTAYLVPVKAGKTTTYNYTLEQGALVTITSTIDGRYIVRNAVTGDAMGVRDNEGLPSAQLRVFGPQSVKIQCVASGQGTFWHSGTDFASATAVGIPATGTTEIAFVAG
jgi:Carboxypeptidase regulatory-like domain